MTLLVHLFVFLLALTVAAPTLQAQNWQTEYLKGQQEITGTKQTLMQSRNPQQRHLQNQLPQTQGLQSNHRQNNRQSIAWNKNQIQGRQAALTESQTGRTQIIQQEHSSGFTPPLQQRAALTTKPASIPPHLQAIFPLKPDHQKHVDAVLDFWERQSSKIERLQADFELLDYDPNFGPLNEPKTRSYGILKYAKPDKGLFRIENVTNYTKQPNGQVVYVSQPAAAKEHWICDGKSIFEFSYLKRQLIQSPLPPEMQGEAITRSSLPFVFGAKAVDIKERYWVRTLAPPDPQSQYLIEFYPKKREDAASYQRVWLLLSAKTYLPEAMQLFAPNFTEAKPARKVFSFKNMEKNPHQGILANINLFHREFYEPALPSGWQKIVEPPTVSLQNLPPNPQTLQTPPNPKTQNGHQQILPFRIGNNLNQRRE